MNSVFYELNVSDPNCPRVSQQTNLHLLKGILFVFGGGVSVISLTCVCSFLLQRRLSGQIRLFPAPGGGPVRVRFVLPRVPAAHPSSGVQVGSRHASRTFRLRLPESGARKDFRPRRERASVSQRAAASPDPKPFRPVSLNQSKMEASRGGGASFRRRGLTKSLFPDKNTKQSS